MHYQVADISLGIESAKLGLVFIASFADVSSGQKTLLNLHHLLTISSRRTLKLITADKHS